MRTVIVSGATIAAGGGRRDHRRDVRGRHRARGRAPALEPARRGAARDARRRGRRDHRAVARQQGDLRQRGGVAALRHPARPGARGLLRPRSTCGASSSSTRPAGRSTSRGCRGGSRSPGSIPSRSRCARATALTGEVRWSRIKATAVRDPDGGVRLAINVVEDITELKRSEEAQRFLAEASRRLAGSLDYERTLAAVGRARGAGDRRRLHGEPRRARLRRAARRARR